MVRPEGADVQRWRPDALLADLAGPRPGRLRHVRRIPERPADPVPIPDWVSPTLTAALLARGTDRLWRHQLEVADAARAGEHVVVATGTASGKSLAYLLPVLSAVLDGTTAPT
ncbi:MAG TPA: DEAD/DEAH box helicase, partial [Dermatophilaceae bacterium]|nr:DEAD/DEAH box helicase [Dermatophilaceae bacterium]